MSVQISQSEAVELFDIPTEVLYVCDGLKPCGKPDCHDMSDGRSCHHTSDASHALYPDHDLDDFSRHPSVRNGKAAVIFVEPIRG